MTDPLLILPVQRGEDVVLARQRAREVAALAGFDSQDRTRIATAVSEVARAALQNAGGGEIAFSLQPGGETAAGDALGDDGLGDDGGPIDRPVLRAVVREIGPGRQDLRAILDGTAGDSDGVAQGPIAARRLMDEFAVDPDGSGSGAGSGAGGAAVRMAKALPTTAPPLTAARVAEVAAELARLVPADPLAELQRQNRELLDALAQLRERQAELTQLNAELEETNRGVVALYAELDEKALSLKRASDLKTRFLSHMSHEFRSPLNSILSLVRILLDRDDGPLTEEQDKQIGFIRQSADSLLTLVNDLLDLAKVEAGKTVVRPERFEVADLLGTLRGMFRPLVPTAPDGRESVTLTFDDPPPLPTLHTDQGKLAQILRNFLSNALKFTDHGEIRVSTSAETGSRITFTVADTGAGIAEAELERIFEEFTQVDSPRQRTVQGTGLGLSLSRKLAEVLGGTVAVRSAPGEGSAFSVTVPQVYGRSDSAEIDSAEIDSAEADPAASDVAELTDARDEAPAAGPTADNAPSSELPVEAAEEPTDAPVLVIEDDPDTRVLYERYLEGSGFEAVGVGTVSEARAALRRFHPAAVLLDIVLEADSGWALLEELKREVATRHIPVLVLTVVDDQERAFSLGADDFCLKPVERGWLLARLNALVGPDRAGRPQRGTALVIDDNAAARYLLCGLLAEAGWGVAEADRGEPGLLKARENPPDVIFLDLVMPDLTGFQVLDQLASEGSTRDVPVVICSTRVLTDAERASLADSSAVILAKDPVSRETALARLRTALEEAGVVAKLDVVDKVDKDPAGAFQP